MRCGHTQPPKSHTHAGAGSSPSPRAVVPQANAVIHAMHAFKPPANVLIWGAGYDSELWCKMNEGGRTVFLEQSKEFAAMVQPLIPSCPIYLVNYTTMVPQGTSLSRESPPLFLPS